MEQNPGVERTLTIVSVHSAIFYSSYVCVCDTWNNKNDVILASFLLFNWVLHNGANSEKNGLAIKKKNSHDLNWFDYS